MISILYSAILYVKTYVQHQVQHAEKESYRWKTLKKITRRSVGENKEKQTLKSLIAISVFHIKFVTKLGYFILFLRLKRTLI